MIPPPVGIYAQDITPGIWLMVRGYPMLVASVRLAASGFHDVYAVRFEDGTVARYYGGERVERAWDLA